MKKHYLRIIAVLVILLLASVSLFAQEDPDPVDVSRTPSTPAEQSGGGGGGTSGIGGGMMVGFKVGIGMSNISLSHPDYETSTSFEFKFGWQVGLKFGYFFGPLGIVADLEYIRKGAESTNYSFGSVSKQELYLDYIDVNLMLGLKFGPLMAGIGFYLGFKINGKLIDDGIEVSAAEYYSKVDYGIVLNVGAKFGMIFVGLDFKYGLADIMSDSYLNSLSEDPDWKYSNWGIYLNFGMLLSL